MENKTGKRKNGILNGAERSWILYDVGNSAFVLMVSTIFPIYFNYLAGQDGVSSADYLAIWGYAASIVTAIVALIGPVCGTIADYRGYKKPLFTLFLMIGAVGCAVLGLCSSWLAFIIIFVIAKVGFSTSLIFYDSMLGDVTTEDRFDKVSADGYAWGYIGSCIPFVASLGIVLGKDRLELSMQQAMIAAFVLVAVWWVTMTVPLLRRYRQINYVEKHPHAVVAGIRRLWNTLKELKNDKKVLLFLVAYFFYIDGVYTIIDMATAYGTALGLDTTGLLVALLVTQIVAFPSAIIFGRLAGRVESWKLILVCVVAYTGVVVFAMFMTSQWQFWVLAVCVGMFQGGIQALSRSHFARIIPAEKSGEYFGLMDICGKGASFVGTMLISIVSQVTGSANLGIGVMVIVFIAGLVFFIQSVSVENNSGVTWDNV